MKLITTILASVIITTVAFATQTAIADTSADIPTEIYSQYERPQLYCLAQNIYHEARGDSLAGRYAVADVVLNRVKDRRYPGTICEVVYQGKQDSNGRMILNRCQFSWYCDGKSDEVTDQAAYDAIRYMVSEVLMGSVKIFDITEGATHYHADYVSPSWANTKTKTVEIEDHIFYRWEF